MSADEVQINANDLLAAYATEVATLTQRAVLAELRAKALQEALESARSTVASLMQTHSSENGEALSRTRDVPLPLDL